MLCQIIGARQSLFSSHVSASANGVILILPQRRRHFRWVLTIAKRLLPQPSLWQTGQQLLRRCIDWLDQIERGESVVVNLRLETDPETKYVGFDRKRVSRILRRIASDLEKLATGQQVWSEGQDNSATRHRRQLAEPKEQPKKLSRREQRDNYAGRVESPVHLKESNVA